MREVADVESDICRPSASVVFLRLSFIDLGLPACNVDGRAPFPKAAEMFMAAFASEDGFLRLLSLMPMSN